MNIDDRPTDLRAHSHTLQKFQMGWNASTDPLHVWF